MRFSALLVALAGFLTLAVPQPALADDAATCISGSGDDTIAACSRAIKSGRKRGAALAPYYSTRGAGYSAMGDNDHALADFNEAIRLDPKLAVAYFNLGKAYFDKGDRDRAIANYSEAIRLEPKAADAYYSRGVVYGLKGDNKRAIADYSESIRLDPALVQAYLNRGSAYIREGDNDRAIADYTAAIGLASNFALAYSRRGDAYLDKGDNDHAIADYGEAINISPKVPDAYSSRGRAYFYSGSIVKAHDDFKRANELSPQNPYAVVWLELAERRNNVPSHLAEAAKKLNMAAWPAPVVRLLLDQLTPAALLNTAQDPDATKQKDQVCEANFYSGELALLMGKKDEATRLFQLAVRDCPVDFNERLGAKTELKTLGAAP